MDDHKCLQRIREGGKLAQAAIMVLYERYAHIFCGYLQRRFRFSREESQDVSHDAFLKLTRLRGQAFTVPEFPRPWLYRILINCAIDYHRRRSLEPSVPEPGDPLDDDGLASVERIPNHLVPEATWANVLAALSAFQTDYPDSGAALELMILEGWSIRELADFLGKKEGATREYLSYWRERLRPYLQRFCPDCFAGSSDDG